MALITIPSPVGGTFIVTIKNSGTGVTVFGPSTENNTPFDPGALAAGDYTMYITYGGHTTGKCFTVTECACPVLDDVFITQDGPSYYGTFSFDFSGGFLCPFDINIITSFSSGIIHIPNLSVFTTVVGDIYSFTFLIGGFAPFDYGVSLPGVTNCYSGHVDVDCGAPSLPTLLGKKVGSIYSVDVKYSDCGDTCQTITWNYHQTSPAGSGVTPDVGTFTDTVNCAGLPDTHNHVLTPDFGLTTPASIIYIFSGTDCCGMVYNWPAYPTLRVEVPV